MGMCGQFLLLDDAAIDKLVADPDLQESFLDVIYESEEMSKRIVDVDKAWHGIHFLLTGSAEPTDSPLSFILSNGVSLEADWGYGPASAFRSAEVATIGDRLAPIDLPRLAAAFDAEAMEAADVYPMAGTAGGWAAEAPGSGMFEDYYGDAYLRLREMVLTGQRNRQGMLVWLT